MHERKERGSEKAMYQDPVSQGKHAAGGEREREKKIAREREVNTVNRKRESSLNNSNY